MKKLLILLILTLFAVIANSSDKDLQSYEFNYYISVKYPEEFSKSLRELTNQSGGFVKYMDKDRMALRIPIQNVNVLVQKIKKESFVQDLEIITKNVNQELINLNVKLNIKEKMYQKISKIIESSSVRQTIDIEKELNRYVIEIENLKGQIRFINNNLNNALIHVYFNQNVNIKQGDERYYSHQSWINQLGIRELLNE